MHFANFQERWTLSTSKHSEQMTVAKLVVSWKLQFEKVCSDLTFTFSSNNSTTFSSFFFTKWHKNNISSFKFQSTEREVIDWSLRRVQCSSLIARKHRKQMTQNQFQTDYPEHIHGSCFMYDFIHNKIIGNIMPMLIITIIYYYFYVEFSGMNPYSKRFAATLSYRFIFFVLKKINDVKHFVSKLHNANELTSLPYHLFYRMWNFNARHPKPVCFPLG